MKKFLIVMLLPLLLLAGCGGTKEVQQAFDIPSLIGKNITEVQAVLGPPKTSTGPGDIERMQGLNDGQMWWKKDEGTIIVQYEINTGRIKYFYLAAGPKTPEEVFTKEEDIMKVGNLKRDAPNYTLKFIRNSLNSGRYFGVKALPSGG